AAPPPPVASATVIASTSPKFVIALFDHDAEEVDELPFKEGERIEVVDSSDEGWWQGICNGKTGLFPVNYVQAEK
ncbi:unnamed protein product, partial [Ectocarpus fasciculatus]